ncbi:MAG: NAD(+) synthase [Coriobacteriales bacterium]|jgi:NAD+ synthase (glutamine-hydrolysing)|nr:NAD(+) synthase [Coriobacteriales bacterium]
MYIAVVQFNPTVGALPHNCDRALAKVEELSKLPYPPDLVVFPAYALTGSELGGLMYHNAFAAECLDVAQRFIAEAKLPTLIGTMLPRPSFGSAHFVCQEEVLFAHDGHGSALGFVDLTADLDEQDYVESVSIKLNGTKMTVILDDFVYADSDYSDSDAIIMMLAKNYQTASEMFTSSSLVDNLRDDALANDAWIVVANLCGAEDSSVFEGASIAISPDGAVAQSAVPFEEAVFTVNLIGEKSRGDSDMTALHKSARVAAKSVQDTSSDSAHSSAQARQLDKKLIKPLLPYEADWKALTVALRDYVIKNGFSDVLVGISGGIDSALVTSLAVEALGLQHVHGVLMPSPHSSAASRTDALALAAGLGISTQEFALDELFTSFLAQSKQVIGTEGSDLAIQNLQARMRTVVLMHLSNTYGWLLLNTGNKSEAAVGYSTLYGDTAGALAPLGNIYKTDVYGLARWLNSTNETIPQAILDKPPSAELYPGQKDSDNIPPYDVLDQILRLHIEEGMGVDEILEFINNYPVSVDIDKDLVVDVLNRVKTAEFKRRQEPLAPRLGGLDITAGRAWPITNGFADHSRNLLAPTEIVTYLNDIYSNRMPNNSDFLGN